MIPSGNQLATLVSQFRRRAHYRQTPAWHTFDMKDGRRPIATSARRRRFRRRFAGQSDNALAERKTSLPRRDAWQGAVGVLTVVQPGLRQLPLRQLSSHCGATAEQK